MNDDLRNRIAAIFEHHREPPGFVNPRCRCGWKGTHKGHDGHLAEALLDEIDPGALCVTDGSRARQVRIEQDVVGDLRNRIAAIAVLCYPNDLNVSIDGWSFGVADAVISGLGLRRESESTGLFRHRYVTDWSADVPPWQGHDDE